EIYHASPARNPSFMQQRHYPGVTAEVCVQITMREANNRGYECLLVEDATESYFPEVKQATLDMVCAQGGIVGWVGTTDDLISGIHALHAP
ncbi:MAG: isochorismatase family protein, partial [Synechococcales cyanobacterium T60_A2020_003]|nr:isochorismatase family protein [Synechococcales cyanobacterium T60_A2020_003]